MSRPRAAALDLVAVVRGDRVRVTSSPTGPVLPAVEASDGWVELPQLLAAAGGDGATLLAPATRLDDPPVRTVHLLGADPHAVWPVPPDGEPPWLALPDLHRLQHPPAVTAAIRTGLAEHRGELPWPPRRPTWFAPGWREAVEGWVDAELEATGLRRTGSGRPVKLWSLSGVVELPVQPVDGSAGPRRVFVKAGCTHFRAEPRITALLDATAPGTVPSLLATDPERAWMLMLPFADAEVGRRPEAAPAAARTMAELQLRMAGRTGELLAAGLPDRRREPTLAGFAEVVHGSVELPLLSPAERDDAVALLPWVEERLTALEATGMPYSIGHGDLHTGNYVYDARGVRIFDWTDAALTYPVLDAVMLAQSAGPAHQAATSRAYLDTWSAGWPGADVAEALRLAPVVERAYQAVSYEGIYRAQEERTRGEMAGVVAQILRGLNQRREAERPSGVAGVPRQ